MTAPTPTRPDDLGPRQRAFIAEHLLKPEKYDRAEQFRGWAATVRTERLAANAAQHTMVRR